MELSLNRLNYPEIGQTENFVQENFSEKCDNSNNSPTLESKLCANMFNLHI